MTPQTLTFQTTPQKAQKLLDELHSSDTVVTGVWPGPFDINGYGINATASYADPTLTVVVFAKPFYVSVKMITNVIKEHLA